MNIFVAFLAVVGFQLSDAVPLSGSNSLSAKNVGAAAAMQSLPLTFVPGNENLLWTFDLKVGSQQKFNLTLDINGAESFLFLTQLRVEETEECGTDNGARRFFDRRLSDTYESANADFNGDMGRYPYLSIECRAKNPSLDPDGVEEAWYAKDTFDFGAFFAEETPFVAVQKVYLPLNPQWRSDGILGLNDFNQKLSTTSAVLSDFDKQEVTLFLKSDPNAGGHITFGGKDTKNCGNKWTTFKRRHKGDWAAYMPNLTLGSANRIALGRNVSLATRSPFLELPYKTFETLVKALGAEYDFATALYTVKCDTASSLPSLGIRLGDPFNPTKDAIRYEVPPSKYTTKMTTSSGPKCALFIVEEEMYGAPKLGTQFLPPGCIHLDYTNEAVSFEST